MADVTSVDLARPSGGHPVQASPDLLRTMVQAFAEALMGAEADVSMRRAVRAVQPGAGELP